MCTHDKALVMAITNCARLIPVSHFILLQMVLFIPFVLVRNLARLSTLAIVADGFIMAGLIYIFWSEINVIAMDGIADVKFFNPTDFPLFIGYELILSP